MSRQLIDRHLQQAQRLLHNLPIENLDRRSLVVKAALEDERLWYVFTDQREHMRRAALLEAGWNFSWSDTGECGAYAAKWLRQGLVCVPSPEHAITHPFGKFVPVQYRTATPVSLLDTFKLWERFIPGTQVALKNVGPGDLVVFNEGKHGHAAIVEKVEGATIHTIEANYSNTVKRVKRTLDGVLGFGSIG